MQAGRPGTRRGILSKEPASLRVSPICAFRAKGLPASGLPGSLTRCRNLAVTSERCRGFEVPVRAGLLCLGCPRPSYPTPSAASGQTLPLPPTSPVPTGPAQSGILVDREVVSLFLHFTVNPKPRVDFIDRPRCCLRGKECSINRFQQVESRWGYSGTSDRIRWARGAGSCELGGGGERRCWWPWEWAPPWGSQGPSTREGGSPRGSQSRVVMSGCGVIRSCAPHLLCPKVFR